jgi:hypothetical protein
MAAIRKLFTPEFRNRLDAIIQFSPQLGRGGLQASVHIDWNLAHELQRSRSDSTRLVVQIVGSQVLSQKQPFDRGRQDFEDSANGRLLDHARPAGHLRYEAQRVRTGCDCGQGFVGIRDTADLQAGSAGQAPDRNRRHYFMRYVMRPLLRS